MVEYSRYIEKETMPRKGIVMIAFIKGTIEEVTESAVVIECGGIGYEVLTSASAVSRLSARGGREAKLFTSMQVREDGVSLIGFPSREELESFTMLCSVSGVGTKAALSILSVLSPSELMLAVVADDVAALSKAPGVGKKIAQRLALELKDKFKTAGRGGDMSAAVPPGVSVGGMDGGAKQDAVDALVSLGYGRSEALRAVMEAAAEDMQTEQILKLALKKLALR